MISELEATFAPGRARKERKRITIQEKMDVIRLMESGERQSDVCKALDLAPSTVATIKNNADKIKRTYTGISASSLSRITYSRSPAMVEMERLLLQWMDDMREKNVSIQRAQILQKAKSLFDDIRLVYGSNEMFTASKGWFHRFKHRAITSVNLEDAQVVNPEKIFDQYALYLQNQMPQITSNKKSEEDCVFEEKFDVADLVDIGQTFTSADPLVEKTQEDDHHDFDEKSVINEQIQLQKNTASISTETNINRENVRKRVLASISSKPKRTKKDSESKDSLDLFFDGIKSTMRQFSATDVHLLKAKIFSIVSEIEVKYLDVAETQTAADFEMVKVKEEPSDYHLEFGDEEEDERTVSILEERMIKEEMNNWHDIRTDDPLYLGDDNSGVEEEASNDNRSKTVEVAFRPVLECCKNICHSIINPERQMQINTEFCALVTKEEKDARVCAQVDVIGDDYKKERTRVYRLPDFSGFDVSVCKRMFCVVFNLTNEMLTNALSKKTFGTGKLPLQS